MMPAEDSGEIEIRAVVERLREELALTRTAGEGAEERIRGLMRERDRLALTSEMLSRREQGLEMISSMVGEVAHDLNNALAVITSGVELLARLDQPERRARVMKRIEDAAWRGSELVRRLHTLAHVSAESGSRARTVAVRRQSADTQSAAGPLSVLVVEDDDEMAALATDMLERLGHHGLRVSTVPAAVAVLSGGEAVDLIFADVLLSGGGSGFDLAREIERRELRLPIVLTSGFGGGMRGRLAAARLPFLPKPYTLAALQQVLRQAAELAV